MSRLPIHILDEERLKSARAVLMAYLLGFISTLLTNRCRHSAKTAQMSRFCVSFGFVVEVDKGVNTVDKRHRTFMSVHEIVSV